MGFRLAPDVNAVLRSFFLSLFRSLKPRISTRGNFMLLVYLVFVFDVSSLFGSYAFQKILKLYELLHV